MRGSEGCGCPTVPPPPPLLRMSRPLPPWMLDRFSIRGAELVLWLLASAPPPLPLLVSKLLMFTLMLVLVAVVVMLEVVMAVVMVVTMVDRGGEVEATLLLV